MSSSLRVLRVRSDDVDELCERLARDFGRHFRVPASSGPMGYELVAIGTRRVVAGTTSANVGSTVRASTAGPTLFVPLDAAGRFRVGRREIEAAGAVGVVLPADHEYTARLSAGSWLALRVDADLLAEALDARRGGRRRAWGIESVEVPLGAEGLAFVRATLARLHQLDAVPDRGAGPAIQRLEQDVARWLADRLVESRGARTVSRDTPTIAELTDRWIREHLAAPIALGDLARVAGASDRVVQKACLAHWGRSPLELVASHRLAAARARLLRTDPRITVTQAAIECGFSHLGRFAIAYRQAYGESPSETLARGAWTTRSPANGRTRAMRHDEAPAGVASAVDALVAAPAR